MGFTRLDYLKHFDPDRVRAVLEEGTEDGIMPSFSRRRRGPLSDTQIDSLVRYFEDLREAWRGYMD